MVKSESWLDLSAIARQQQEQHHNRSPVTTKLHPTPSSATSHEQQQVQRRPIARAVSLEPTGRSFSSIRNHNQSKREHLLIRIRQQSFLERSNSTTLSSSNLSRSIDLEGSLVDRASLNGSTADNRDCLEERLSEQQLNDITRGGGESISISNEPTQTKVPRRELSFGLKSFRERFERKRQQLHQARRRLKAPVASEEVAPVCDRLNSNHNNQQQQLSSNEPSPLVRSWSSLSERVNSRLISIGHSWKLLHHKYLMPERSHKWSQEERLREIKRNDNEDGRHQVLGPRLHAGQLVGRFHSDQLMLSNVRERLTRDWVAAQQHAAREGFEADAELGFGSSMLR